MELLEASETETSLYSFSTLGSTEDYYHDAATEFDTSLEELEDRADNALWELEEGCDLQLLHMIPMEILNKVLSYCSPTTLCHLGRCSTQTLSLTSQSWIWRDLMLRQWGPDLASGLYSKKRLEFETSHDMVEPPSRILRPTASLSDLSQASASSASSSSHTASLQMILDDQLAEHGAAAWEEWKSWYCEVHRATRLIKFEVRHGIRDLVEKYGLPNTTGAIARLLKCCMNKLASYALRDFLHQQSNINIASYFFRLWNFKGLTVLQMMRLVLGCVRLPRSDSSISRVLEVLSLAWWEQNPPTEEELNTAEDLAAASSSPSSASPPSSPSTSTPALLRQRLESSMTAAAAAAVNHATTAGGERMNTLRVLQPIHLSPLATLDSANPWEQYKVPIYLNSDDLRPRGGFGSPDAISTLCFAILMLETDQRTSAVKMKMTESAFVSQSRGLNSGRNYPREMLRETYNSIKFHPLILFTDRTASGRIQVHTTVPRFLWLSSNRTCELRAEVCRGHLRVWDLDEDIARQEPLHIIPLNPSSTIVRCDFIAPSWLSTSMGTEENAWNSVEIETLSVLGSTFFKFLIPAGQTQKWISALHWNLHSSILEPRAPSFLL